MTVTALDHIRRNLEEAQEALTATLSDIQGHHDMISHKQRSVDYYRALIAEYETIIAVVSRACLYHIVWCKTPRL